MVGGILFTPTVRHTIVALEPETGKEIWKYELGRAVAAPMRGLTYWPGDKENPAEILAGTSDGKLIALNAKTGKLVPGFGNEGAVNLRIGVTEKFPAAPYHIARQSEDLARDFAYRDNNQDVDPQSKPQLSQNYETNAANIILDQSARAGFRLATLINLVLK